MRPRFYSMAMAVLLAPMLSTMQAQIVDQSNYAIGTNLSGSLYWRGQTFTPSANTSAGAGFHLENVFFSPLSGILRVELWSQVASNSGATLLASGSSAFNLAANQQSMVDVFWSAVAVTPGTQYFLAMNVPGNLGYIYQSASFNTYAGGDAWYNSSTNDTDPYTQFSGIDLTFEEFSSSQVTTPEPASLALLGTGLFGLVPMMRRKLRK